MDYTTYKKLEKIDTLKFEDSILKAVRKNYHEKVYYKSVLVASVLYLMQRDKIDSWDVLYTHIIDLGLDRELKDELLKNVEEVDESLLDMLYQFSDEEILAYIIFSKDNVFSKKHDDTTPESIVNLSIELLDIRDNDTVLDLCSGRGTFLLDLAMANDQANLIGLEQSFENVILTKLKAFILSKDINLIKEDVFSQDYSIQRANKYFANFPIGYKVGEIIPKLNKFFGKYKYLEDVKKSSSADWVYSKIITDVMDKGDKTVVIVSNSSIWNDADIDFRRKYLNDKVIEAVIKLPSKMFSSLVGGVSLIVFSHNNNTVKFIDASKNYVENRKLNVLSDINIKNIIEEYNLPANRISYGEIKYPFNLDPSKYIIDDSNNNIINLEEAIISAKRGASIKSDQLDQLITKEESDYKYLMINDIEDGLISNNLTNLSDKAKEFDRFIIEENDLLLTKNGQPFKSTVAKNIGSDKIIANGNLYIIKIDNKKFNPIYIQAFLESDQGQKAILRASKGTAIKNISIKDLNKVQIPKLTKAEQDEIAKEYESIQSKIENIKIDLRKLRENKEKNIFK